MVNVVREWVVRTFGDTEDTLAPGRTVMSIDAVAVLTDTLIVKVPAVAGGAFTTIDEAVTDTISAAVVPNNMVSALASVPKPEPERVTSVPPPAGIEVGVAVSTDKGTVTLASEYMAAYPECPTWTKTGCGPAWHSESERVHVMAVLVDVDT
jgi:hypothetical protein